MTDWVNFSALWRILLFGLLFGAALPAVFAVGLRALSLGHAAPADQQSASARPERPRAGGAAIAGVCFALVVAAGAAGIYLVVHAA